jgi:hypothetical protein
LGLPGDGELESPAFPGRDRSVDKESPEILAGLRVLCNNLLQLCAILLIDNDLQYCDAITICNIAAR